MPRNSTRADFETAIEATGTCDTDTELNCFIINTIYYFKF